MTTTKLVIIGGVAAGASCAARARRLNEFAQITLIERENPDWNDLAVTMLGFDPLPSAPLPFRHPGESRDPRTRNW